MTEDPIYTFPLTRRALSAMGIRVGIATAYREVENKEVNLNDPQSRVSFTDEGIFWEDPRDGVQRQIFLYKWNYKMKRFGKPRFHIRQCQTIRQFMASGAFTHEYRRANTEQVMVHNIDTDKDETVENLPLCGYCARLIAAENPDMKSSDFVAILRKADEGRTPDRAEVDLFGYTRDWEAISTAYRELKDYTCERCGLHIDNPFDRQYIHVHHRDGNKLNNRTSNLECLCIRCHARSDAHHTYNFSRGANRIRLEQFAADYPEKTNP